MNSNNHTVHITGYNSNGDGVGRLDSGKVVFVRGAVREDVCSVTVTEDAARSCRAVISEVLKPSPYRIEPDCPSYHECGGCDFRHITYEEELWAKKNRVNDALSKIAKSPLHVKEVLTTGQPDGYRNKAVFHCTEIDDEPVIGFFRAGSNEICPVRHCRLLPDELNERLHDLWDRPPISPPAPLSVAIAWRFGARYNMSPAIYELDGLKFTVSPDSFFQVNTDAALLLYSKAREFAALTAAETLVDLYCGVGSLTLFIGRDAGRAIGIESNPVAVQDAISNARQNNMTHIDFICADAAHWDAGVINPDCVVVDPPRRGLSRSAVNKILRLSPSRIVYVSCDPATMARDIRLLGGYTPKRAAAVDMFPRTANVECCVLLEK